MSSVDGLAVHFPDPNHQLLIWLINQAKTSFIDGLWSVVDFALILRTLVAGQDTSIWQTLAQLAHDHQLGRAYDLALLRLGQSGIWPFHTESERALETRLANRLLTREGSPIRLPSQAQRWGLKIWMSRPGYRRALFKRALGLY
jgi:hypothetical protein